MSAGRRLTEREWDRALRIQTIGRADETGAKYMPYEPTPYPVLERLAASGFLRPDDHLLDYGCGKGRVAFFLAARIGCRVTGIDHSEKLVAMAEANRARAACAASFILVNGFSLLPSPPAAAFISTKYCIYFSP